MFNKKLHTPSFNTAVAAALVGSVALVVTVLIEAVLGMQSYL
jgi:hypothetical protein